MRTVISSEGGLIRAPKDKDSKRRFRQERRETRNMLKTGADFAAEREAAQERWAGVPPVVAAREIIAEAKDLAPELLGQISAAISGLSEEQLAELVNSGQLSQQLAELAAG